MAAVGRKILVLGREKTGTTVISHCVAKTAGITRVVFEPRHVSELSCLRRNGGVAKIVFEQWRDRTDLLRDIVTGQVGPRFDTVIVIVRDPRAGAISSVLYQAYGWFLRPENAHMKEAWLAPYRRKQANPDAVSMQSVLIDLAALRGEDYGGRPPIDGTGCNRWLDFIKTLPADSHVILGYEDFIANRLDGHPCQHLLGDDRTVTGTYARTRRTAGQDDWRAYLHPQEQAYLNECFAEFLTRYGYPQDIRKGGPIRHEHCAGYVERLIDEAIRTGPRG